MSNPPTLTIDDQVAELLDKMANGTVSRLKAKYQFNHSGRQALEMFADDIKANVKVRNKLSLLITKAEQDGRIKAVTDIFMEPTEGLFSGKDLFIKRAPIEQVCINLIGYEAYKAITEAATAAHKTTNPSYSPAPGTDGEA